MIDLEAMAADKLDCEGLKWGPPLKSPQRSIEAIYSIEVIYSHW
jgi:hypothetical protein